MQERDIFLSALEIEDPAARQAHLKSACADDAELLFRIESLLASHESRSQFLNTPAVEQIDAGSARGTDPTIQFESGASRDVRDEAATLAENKAKSMAEHEDDLDDEIPFGYLEPSTRPDALGRLGHYEILEVVGSGAFGTVLKAFDEKLQRMRRPRESRQ